MPGSIFPVKRPIVVIGAARSGTKALRAALASHPECVAVPYDINYVWKFGNYRIPHDELLPDDLGLFARQYIHWFFWRTQLPRLGVRVVEKTVSNTLRVDFVRHVFPDCQFVHLLRDGRDVAASARRMWSAPADWRALLAKTSRFPLAAIPSYGARYARSYLTRAFGSSDHVSSWGPRFRDIDEVVLHNSLIETCGIQWRRSVESAREALSGIPQRDVVEVTYEEFVARPVEELGRIMDSLGLELAGEVVDHVRQSITASNVGKWRKELLPDELEALMNHIGPVLEELKYEA